MNFGSWEMSENQIIIIYDLFESRPRSFCHHSMHTEVYVEYEVGWVWFNDFLKDWESYRVLCMSLHIRLRQLITVIVKPWPWQLDISIACDGDW